LKNGIACFFKKSISIFNTCFNKNERKVFSEEVYQNNDLSLENFYKIFMMCGNNKNLIFENIAIRADEAVCYFE
jgi:hypothetical protein